MFGNQIAMCCGTPMVKTFVFPGSEWYCPVCGDNVPFLNPTTVEPTEELIAQAKANREAFAKASSACIPNGARLEGCKQCEAGENHNYHCTEEERQASHEAYAALAGGILEPTP